VVDRHHRLLESGGSLDPSAVEATIYGQPFLIVIPFDSVAETLRVHAIFVKTFGWRRARSEFRPDRDASPWAGREASQADRRPPRCHPPRRSGPDGNPSLGRPGRARAGSQGLLSLVRQEEGPARNQHGHP